MTLAVALMNAATKTNSARFQPSGNRSTALPAGTPAPDFALKSTPDQIVRLSEFRGQPVVLVFYPADWSPVCGDQLALYQAIIGQFGAYGAQLVGMSLPGPRGHQAYRDNHGLTFPLLSDFEPKGELARRYGVYRAGDG